MKKREASPFPPLLRIQSDQFQNKAILNFSTFRKMRRLSEAVSVFRVRELSKKEGKTGARAVRAALKAIGHPTPRHCLERHSVGKVNGRKSRSHG